MTTLRVQGLSRTRQGMRKRLGRLRGTMKAANQAAAVQLLGWTQRNMNREGLNHDSRLFAWPPLKASTIADRQRKGFWPGRMLQRTGALFSRWDIRSDSRRAVLKSGVDYSGTHEFGKGKVPQRKILPGVKQALKIVAPIYRGKVKVAIK